MCRTHQLPAAKQTHVGWLFVGRVRVRVDVGLQTAMASVRIDNGADGMHNDFEKLAAHLLPYDPVAKKCAAATQNKRDAAQISSVDLEEESVKGKASSTMMPKKASIGKMGVHLQYHMLAEYDDLSNEQKDELREWRRQNPSKKKSGDKEVRKRGQEQVNQTSVGICRCQGVEKVCSKGGGRQGHQRYPSTDCLSC